MSKGIFITGTGTDVGKTFVTALVVKKLRAAGRNAGYFKAAVSGNEWHDGHLIPGDAEYVQKIAHIDGDLADMVPFIYEHAVSPHLASKLEGNPVTMKVVTEYYRRICQKHDYVTVEGSGGILCPIRFDQEIIWLEDIVKELQLDSLIVADAGLGTINSTVLTIDYMERRGMKVKGVILNHFQPKNEMHLDNLKMIEYQSGIPIIACVKDGDDELAIDINDLIKLFN